MYHPDLMEFLTKLVTGSILADCLTFHEQLENGRLLDGVTVVFDTARVFMALGIDEAQRQEHYTTLISALKAKGARVVMFQHSYNEMQYIVLGAADWVENVLYDPLKASETTAYFRSVNATRNEVLEYSDALKQHITDIGIDIIDVDYDTKTHVWLKHDNRYYRCVRARLTDLHYDTEPDGQPKRYTGTTWGFPSIIDYSEPYTYNRLYETERIFNTWEEAEADIRAFSDDAILTEFFNDIFGDG